MLRSAIGAFTRVFDALWREARLAEEAIGRTIAIAEHDECDEDDANAFHVSRGRPTTLIIPFPRRGRWLATTKVYVRRGAAATEPPMVRF
jgi:hypothetical protein